MRLPIKITFIIDFETQSWILKLDKSKDDILLDSREELEDVFKA